jgi:hypothetical protein
METNLLCLMVCLNICLVVSSRCDGILNGHSKCNAFLHEQRSTAFVIVFCVFCMSYVPFSYQWIARGEMDLYCLALPAFVSVREEQLSCRSFQA